ncbi:hypothetical protein CEXT_656491 [Caerostris extrusa]|uniref:Uncharacterized protein n=1 Tax=Caerostris extrusa TaxID=172846 RepID=A0AAV4UGC9_CAEEX|nr:hypothetical protein CEXT_656491 [Caerostris extrusa]
MAHKVTAPNFHNCPSHNNSKKKKKKFQREKEFLPAGSGWKIVKLHAFLLGGGHHCSCPSRFPINDAVKLRRREQEWGNWQLAGTPISDAGDLN